MLRRLCIIITVAVLCQLHSSLTLAETKKPKQPTKFLANPLEVTTTDPLLPPSIKRQPLTLPELQSLERALDELNQEAAAKLQAGDQDTAFEIWNREARLRWYLGSLAQVQTLSRFGAIAWGRNASEQVRFITQRLQTIQKQAQRQKTVDLDLMRSLGEAYQSVRSPQLALAVYDQILTAVQQQQDAVAVLQTLTIMGELHLSWFDYPQAAATYERLLNLTATQSDKTSQLTYLQQLRYIYQQTKQPQPALDVLKRIAEIYEQENNLIKIPELKLAIGSNYETIAQENPSLLKEAFNNYQEAYLMGMRSRQYARAAEALQKLIALYRTQEQIDEALQTSQILIETQEQAVNYYGMMQAYDQIGQLYLERQEYPQALAAFQKGLEIAQQIKHKETYFAQQIEKATK
ncbi:tetratricopeptide repeat protein [Nodularia sp. UHCC 0506]|uniref:tetratricopeptide repeat protein n=1 Tax=Nodularia sp. UHCC 0506 TaxID=3110243 RepID=UPI002B216994|nr:tetratricopeptide repeat protein [Nodularia sp. UHCC 0506]MEA5516025.1 tetratricopeptide repeat protein [Nodularia sp. UHCC 0506]